MGKRQEEMEKAQQALTGYATLERKNCDETGWLQLKFGWSRRKAVAMVEKLQHNREPPVAAGRDPSNHQVPGLRPDVPCEQDHPPVKEAEMAKNPLHQTANALDEEVRRLSAIASSVRESAEAAGSAVELLEKAASVVDFFRLSNAKDVPCVAELITLVDRLRGK
jgi:hypothetical protein